LASVDPGRLRSLHLSAFLTDLALPGHAQDRGEAHLSTLCRHSVSAALGMVVALVSPVALATRHAADRELERRGVGRHAASA
jgi:hypothetical protein